jgi:hypothetical protein
VSDNQHALTLRVDEDTWQWLRRESYEQVRPVSEIIREALDAHRRGAAAQPLNAESLKAQWQAKALNEVTDVVKTWSGSIYRADLIHYLRARALALLAPTTENGEN